MISNRDKEKIAESLQRIDTLVGIKRLQSLQELNDFLETLSEPLSVDDIENVKVKDGVDYILTPQDKEEIASLIPKPEDGKDYLLTPEDKTEIAGKITVPIVEKVIERTEVVHEQPIVTNEIVKEIKEVALPITEEEIYSKLNAFLEQGGKIDAKYISNLPRQGNRVFGFGKFILRGKNAGTYISRGDEINELNLSTGLSGSITNGVLTITGTGGSSTPTSPTSGVIDTQNAAFVFAAKPTLIVSDGVQYRENFGWTWSGSTATLAVPPTYDVFGL